jgi:hypothetical protein
MEKFKSIICVCSSLLFLMLLVLVFSCEEKRTVTVEENNGDTIKTTTTTETKPDTEYYHRFKDESRKLEIKLMELADKAKLEGGKIGNSIKERTHHMEGERKRFQNDSTAFNNTKVREDWKIFKEKTYAAIDSLEKKLNH